MRARLVTRDISTFPHRDLQLVPVQCEITLWWGEKPVPKGYVTMIDLGDQPYDFGGGLTAERAQDRVARGVHGVDAPARVTARDLEGMIATERG